MKIISIVIGIILLAIGLKIYIDTEVTESTLTNLTTLTNFNQSYHAKMLSEGKPLQETPWGFQEISLRNKVEHTVKSIEEYQSLIKRYSNQKKWKDNKVHIINFSKGVYTLPLSKSYYILSVPSETIIEGAGMGKTIFKAITEIQKNDKFHFRRVFNLEYATHDVVIRGISFYNKTKDNKWGLFHSNGSYNRENYLFENIEFDDRFGAIGKNNFSTNFITFRGLKKRLGNTTKRIYNNFKIPIPANYQFQTLNDKNIELASQIGVRAGNSVVFHDCKLGDNISATIDIYSNYVEIVGVSFINPLHDHSIKSPNGNHLYIHDSLFELSYQHKLIEGSYWNPTFFTHEGGGLPNYHFKNLTFKRKGAITAYSKSKNKIKFIESEPFMLYDNRAKNVSGDMIWENISFNGYSRNHQVVGYPNVQTEKGYDAINYTKFKALPAQLKANNNNSRANFNVDIKQSKSSSKKEGKGVYSWGSKSNETIDYPRNNRLSLGSKEVSINSPYVSMHYSTVKAIYNEKIK